jgi:hypothetical protein
LIPLVFTKRITSLRPLGTPQQPLTPICQKAAPDPPGGPRTRYIKRCKVACRLTWDFTP